MDYKKISVLLPPSEFDRLEAYCAETGHKKSPLVARLIRDHLNVEGFHVHSAAVPATGQGKRANGDRRTKGRGGKAD
jgi:hypothetical protein